jgi:hypothetical protein
VLLSAWYRLRTLSTFMFVLHPLQLRRQERQAGTPDNPLLSSAKRSKRSPAGKAPGAAGSAAASPAASQGAAAAAQDAEPDPRLCLWEPPVSPYGLLGE